MRLALFYVSLSLVMNFFNCALAACAPIRFSGGQPTMSDGLRRAGQRLPAIALWSLLAATVGVLLSQAEQRLPAIGKLAVKLVGFAWGMATFLVVPILAMEEEPLMATVRNRGGCCGAWGEQLTFDFGFGAMVLLYLLPGVALVLIGNYYSAVVLALGVAAVAAAIIGEQAIEVMFQVALYRYAAGDSPVDPLAPPQG